MIRSIIATIMLALIAVHVAAGEEDLATQIKALQKERLETLKRLVKIYTLQYKAGACLWRGFCRRGDRFSQCPVGRGFGQCPIGRGKKLPDAVITVVENARC